LTITHHPTARIDTALARTPKIDPAILFQQWVQAIKDLTGLDFESPLKLIQSLGELLVSSTVNLPNLAALLGLPPLSNPSDPLEFLGSLFDNTPFNDRMIDVYDYVLGGLAYLTTNSTWEPSGIPGFDAFAEQIRKVWFGLDGIDLEGGPGAVLTAIISRLASAIPDLFSISRITNAIQDLARGAGEFLNADALIDGPFEWDDTVAGWLSGKSAKATADGTTQIIRTDVFEVFEGQTLSQRAAAMWSGYTGSGATIKSGWSFFDAAGDLISDVAKGSITPGAGSGAWQWIPVTAHQVPAGVKWAAQFLQLGSGATAGNVWFSNAMPWASNLGAQALIQDLPEDLEALLDWLTNFVEEGLSKLGVPAVGTLFDKINDLTDEWAIVQDTGDNAVAALEDIGDIFDAALITPTQAAAVKVQGFFEKFFGGGPWNVLSQNQLAAASGAAPLDAGGTVPLENMHPSLIGAMLGVSYATLEIPSNQSIPNATETKLASWSQTGPATLTFTSDNFKLPYAGFWDIEVCSLWGASSTGIRECALKRNGTVIKAEGVPANGFSVYGPRNNVTTRVNATTTDEFSVHVAQTSGGALNCMASGTFVRCTFVGTTDTPVAVTFDAASAGTSGTYSEYGFNHTFGANAQTLVVPISHTGNSTLTAVVVRNAANPKRSTFKFIVISKILQVRKSYENISKFYFHPRCNFHDEFSVFDR
jgi:hypothetical protein